MTPALREARGKALAALRPPAREKLSHWIEGNIHLPEGVASQPGLVRLWPYQPEIADAIGDPLVERVTIVKSVRVGFTTLLTGAMASYVANEPSPILVLLPTEADCRDYVVSDVEPTFDASPTLKGRLSGDQKDLDRNTMLSRRFPGGSLKVVAAKAPRNLRRHNVRILFVDEADEMEAGPQGNPIVIAEKRTLSFSDRKIVIGSTPVDASTSNVLRSYELSDKRIFEVPCLECGAFHEIKWSNIVWPEGEPDKAAYQCPSCEAVIESRRKATMVRQGQWRITAPEVKGHAGFRLNALVSLLPNASWAKLAAEFLQAKNDPDTLKVFVNTILAEGWADEADAVDELDLAGRAEKFGTGSIPEEVLYLTAGVDVQDDRLEMVLIGWDRDGAMLVLDHMIFFGSPDEDATWAALDKALTTRWKHPLGGEIAVDAVCVDSGDGDWMTAVYRFCFPRGKRGVMAIKGMGGSRAVLEVSKTKITGGRLFIVGVDVAKTTIFNRLQRGKSVRFSNALPLAWFEQLASEHKVIRYSRGRPMQRFERKPGRRAEALDCVVYAYAARQAVPSLFDQREAFLRGQMESKPTHARPQTSWVPRRNNWLDRR
ncbi:phage terminase large subunit family protein [Arvimicrobium flavum]|uniref:phage terminase large subunit family protein n=1 Tax=Arvimicrobium flavum TaxID=3393320 RepID=UPI00237B3373|nr:phage terminase large subunit family protein [Mesorhizobium shangrilense]